MADKRFIKHINSGFVEAQPLQDTTGRWHYTYTVFYKLSIIVAMPMNGLRRNDVWPVLQLLV